MISLDVVGNAGNPPAGVWILALVVVIAIVALVVWAVRRRS